jgi:hypothetical protein
MTTTKGTVYRTPLQREEDRGVIRHALYKDPRQKTGLCFYCPEQDWRFPATGEEDLICFCPGCGLPIQELRLMGVAAP